MQTAFQDTIVALATPSGVGAIGIIRLSGSASIEITNAVFSGKDLNQVASHTLHYGHIQKDGRVLDEVVISVFKGPRSYTKEDVIEISGHGSPFVLQQIIELLIEQGARAATAGEFTRRAFINGRFDLAQAEAVADIIAAENRAMQDAALNQMRGGFSNDIKALRDRLIHFASMIELELDFAEEDVEFANRDELRKLIAEIQQTLYPLIESFQWGNVIKKGVPVVIAGKPNAGKSTLLNALLNEERAIVSDIAGTTRDVIEDQLVIDGIGFRFIDTAGLRDTTDTIEAIGVEKTRQKLKEASLILFLIDLSQISPEEFQRELEVVKAAGRPFLTLGNKVDLLSPTDRKNWEALADWMPVSASEGIGLDALKKALIEKVRKQEVAADQTVVTNNRHYDSLIQTRDALLRVLEGIDRGTSNDFVAMDIRQALHHLGEITGEITTDDLLANIFSKFCIGK